MLDTKEDNKKIQVKFYISIDNKKFIDFIKYKNSINNSIFINNLINKYKKYYFTKIL